jgi:DNA-binding Xre family transcriptional regulator
MTISWNFKKVLNKKHSITSATELKKLISEKTGVTISLQNICNYLNETPAMIRLETIEIICTATDCTLQDFLEISPSKKKIKGQRKLSYKNTPNQKKAVLNFPNPEDYES